MIFHEIVELACASKEGRLCVDVPESNGSVTRATGEHTTIRTKLHRQDCFRMTCTFERELTPKIVNVDKKCLQAFTS